ncbi:MAG: hypothetical protein ACOC1H_00455 [Desulfosalsimonas sp.]
MAEVARTICRAMRLNEDLAEAVALGHDLGIRLLAIPGKPR